MYSIVRTKKWTRCCCSALVLLSALSGLVSKPLNAATTNASVTANIIIAMSLSTQSNMEFGDISTSSSSGSVILNTEGVRTTVGGATINSSAPGRPAEFNASGEPGAIFSISMPSSITLTDPANNTMLVDNFVSDPLDNGQLDASGNKTVLVGATIHVASKQAFGSYTGLITLNVDYD